MFMLRMKWKANSARKIACVISADFYERERSQLIRLAARCRHTHIHTQSKLKSVDKSTECSRKMYLFICLIWIPLFAVWVLFAQCVCALRPTRYIYSTRCDLAHARWKKYNGSSTNNSIYHIFICVIQSTHAFTPAYAALYHPNTSTNFVLAVLFLRLSYWINITN